MIAVASAYHQSDPRVIHATGCLMSRLSRVFCSFPSIRFPWPAIQLSQWR